MSSVNTFPRDEWHAPLLMGVLFREVSEVFAAEDWGGLRQSHFRVLSSVPAGGASVTALAGRVGMTKQGCGQFVTALTGTGHLEVAVSPEDGRVRRVRRTELGERVLGDVRRRILQVEDAWAARVGRERYAGFRRVLEDLAQPDAATLDP